MMAVKVDDGLACCFEAIPKKSWQTIVLRTVETPSLPRFLSQEAEKPKDRIREYMNSEEERARAGNGDFCT